MTNFELSTNDAIYLSLLIIFCIGFISLATAFLLKKRRERRKAIKEVVEEVQGLAIPDNDEAPEEHQDSVGNIDPRTDDANQPVALSTVLAKTRSGFWGKLSSLFQSDDGNHEALVEAMEPILFGADLGFQSANMLLEKLTAWVSAQEGVVDMDAAASYLKTEIAEMLLEDKKEMKRADGKPYVALIVGVNGVGKTTTIGKLASKAKLDELSVVLGAGDTFRAAAGEQLEVWAERTGASIIKGPENGDPSSVLFDAIKMANEQNIDLALCDTAGRLHNKSNLMAELSKMRRVVGKAREGAPDEVLLVLDATTGQNGLAQAKEFIQAAGVTGVILTKLDGTAKGGVVVAICNEYKLPIRFIGVGEKAEDLRVFDAAEFVEALMA